MTYSEGDTVIDNKNNPSHSEDIVLESSTNTSGKYVGTQSVPNVEEFTQDEDRIIRVSQSNSSPSIPNIGRSHSVSQSPLRSLKNSLKLKRFYSPARNNFKFTIISEHKDESSSPRKSKTPQSTPRSDESQHSEPLSLVRPVYQLDLADNSIKDEESETKSGGKRHLLSHRKHSPKSRLSDPTILQSEESSGEQDPPPPNYIPSQPELKDAPMHAKPLIPPKLKHTQSPRKSTEESESGSTSSKKGGSRHTLDIDYNILRRLSGSSSSRNSSRGDMNDKQTNYTSGTEKNFKPSTDY